MARISSRFMTSGPRARFVETVPARMSSLIVRLSEGGGGAYVTNPQPFYGIGLCVTVDGGPDDGKRVEVMLSHGDMQWLIQQYESAKERYSMAHPVNEPKPD